MKHQKSVHSQLKSSLKISKDQKEIKFKSFQPTILNSKANKIRTKLLINTDAENIKALRSNCMINSRTAIQICSCFEPIEITINNPMEVGTPSKIYQYSTPKRNTESNERIDPAFFVKKLQNKQSISMRKFKHDESFEFNSKDHSVYKMNLKYKYEVIKKGFKYLQSLFDQLKRRTKNTAKVSIRLNNSNSNSNIMHSIIKLSSTANSLGSIERENCISAHKADTEHLDNTLQVNDENSIDNNNNSTTVKKSLRKTFFRRHTYTSGKVSGLKKGKPSTFKDQNKTANKSEIDINNDIDESANNIIFMNFREDDTQPQESSLISNHNHDQNTENSLKSCIKLYSADNIGKRTKVKK